MSAQRPADLSEDSSIEDAIDRFAASLERTDNAARTIAAYCGDLKQFARFLHPRIREGFPTVACIDADIVAQFDESLRGRGLRPATVARKMAALRRFCRFLCRLGLLPRNPAGEHRVSPPAMGSRTPALERAQVEAALDSADGDDFASRRDRAILEVLYGCGVRLEEVVGLTLSALSALDDQMIKVTGEKGARTVPIGSPAVKALRAYLLSRADLLVEKQIGQIDAGALFVNTAGRRLHRRSVQRIVERNLKAAADVAEEEVTTPTGRPGSGPQALRQAFADHLLEAGADSEAVRRLLGRQTPAPVSHRDEATIESLQRGYTKAHPRAQ